MERMRKNGRKQRSRGVALAEAALVMMLLCTVTLGALQYGWFFYCLHTVTNAARQGARVAAALDNTPTDGDDALENALSPILLAAANPRPRVTAFVDAQEKNCVQGQVIILKTSPAIRLLPITFLPVPDCKATVIMAKEG